MGVPGIVRGNGFGRWRATKFTGDVAEGQLADARALAFKPMTFMNESGTAVGALAQFFKIEPARIVVFHDELDLAPGRLRTKRGGGNGGANWLRSLHAHIRPDYHPVAPRLGHPRHQGLELR